MLHATIMVLYAKCRRLFLFFFASALLFQGLTVGDMHEEEWAELMRVVTEDMQGVPQSGTGGVFPLAPASKGKAGKVIVSLFICCDFFVMRARAWVLFVASNSPKLDKLS